jgi:putative sugar O-methyltransferase
LVVDAERGQMTDWAALTRRTLAGIEVCDPIYRPTSFWRNVVPRLLVDLETNGLETFKSWPTAATWFYPTYGSGFTQDTIDAIYESASQINPAVEKGSFADALNGTYRARRDFDAVRLVWDHSRWPYDLEGLGESLVGRPPEFFRLWGPDRDVGWTRPYLNYLLCLAALSHHVDSPPRSLIEIGGGFGVLGEIVMSRDPDARYVNLDLPPLLTVSSYYLDGLFGDRVTVYDDAVADTGPVELPASGCLPNWRIADVPGPFDVFVNSFSFQEMEPDVVEHYVSYVAAKRVSYVVSLNSRVGKPKATAANEIGVAEQVTSSRIIALFEARGYELVGRYGEPLLQSSGELAILRRKGLPSRQATAVTAIQAGPTTDLRRQPIKGERRGTGGGGGRGLVVRLARDWVPPRILRAARRIRARTR